MGLDIRLPIGLLFLVFGLALVGAGLGGDVPVTRAAVGAHANLGWGLVMGAFGAVMLWLCRRARRP